MLFELEERRSFNRSCPKCSGDRKKSNTKSLSVYRDEDGVVRYKCHHPGCEWNEWQWAPDPHPVVRTDEEIKAVFPIPSDVEISSEFNGDQLFWYRDKKGSYLFANRRIEIPSGKVYVPFIYTDAGFVSGKEAKWPKDYKGLYGAETIEGKEKAIVVEGEKAAEAAKIRFPKYAVVSWLGGANNISKADWELLRDIDSVLLWPDNDEAGKKVMRQIASLLPVNKVLIANVEHLPHKADLADGISDADIATAIKNATDLSPGMPGVFSIADIKKQIEASGKARSTGYDVLDSTTPLPGSGLVVVEGRTKHGKSALAVALTSSMLS